MSGCSITLVDERLLLCYLLDLLACSYVDGMREGASGEVEKALFMTMVMLLFVTYSLNRTTQIYYDTPLAIFIESII